MDPAILWFILAVILFIGYAILDGFDLGVGILHLFAHSDDERRLYRQAVVPFWDGNELWLAAGFATLFHAFPGVHDALFGGSWLIPGAVILILLARTAYASLCPRLKKKLPCRMWSRGLGLVSLLIVLVFGAAAGNLLRGVPLNRHGVFEGTVIDLLNPYALLVSILVAITFAMHGAVWLALKTDGELRRRMPYRIRSWWQAFLMCYLMVTIATLFVAPHIFVTLPLKTAFWVYVILLLLGILGVSLFSRFGKFPYACAASSLIILCLLALTSIGIYPRLVPSSLDLAFSLTVDLTSAGPEALSSRLAIALAGFLLLLWYTIRTHQRKGRPAPVETNERQNTDADQQAG
jgi:cytochrome d ubiquinol oxidase subunit II